MRCRVLYDFVAETDMELSVKESEEVTVIDQTAGDGWWTAKNASGVEGMVPTTYLEALYDHVPDNRSDSSWSDSDPGWGGDFTTANHQRPSEPAHSSAPDYIDPPSNSSGSISGSVPPPSGTTKGVIGKDFSRFKRYTKVGAEDFIIGNVSKKCGKKIYKVSDLGHAVQWMGGMNSGLGVSILENKTSKKFNGLKAYTVYVIRTCNNSKTVERRYKHFDWLSLRLDEQFPCSLLPKLPEKQASGRFDSDFVSRRQILLDKWLREICRHPVVSESKLIQKFISIPTDAEAQWKGYKREMEKYPYQNSGFFQGVDVPANSRFLSDSSNQLKKFETFSKTLDTASMHFADALGKSLKIHDTVIKREILSVGAAFDELGKVFQTKTQKEGSAELAGAAIEAGKTFKESASIVTSSALESTIPVLDCLWVYNGLLSNVEGMIEVGKQSQEKVESNVLKLQGTSAGQELNFKKDSINAVLLSEADYLDQIRIPDFTRQMKQYLAARADYHRRQMVLFEDAAAKFGEL